MGSCQQTDGSSSLSVGTTLGSVNKDGVTTARSVVDVNTVDAASSFTVVNGQTVAATWTPVGWLYLDNNGGLWFQKDPASVWSVQYNLNINQYLGVGFTPPVAQLPVYVKPPTSTPLANNLEVTKCWVNGRALVPGTVVS